MLNTLTIDVEDFFHTKSNFMGSCNWDNYGSRIESDTYRLLKLLAASPSLVSPIPSNLKPGSTLPAPNSEPRTPIRATFFCFGWIAKKYPYLIKEIQAQGHEVACHGFAPHLVYLMSEKEFRLDIRKAKAVLEDLTGVEVLGYRAPCFSINQRSLWALKVIAEEGFRYDSSIFPVHHDLYGFREAPRFPFMVNMNGNGSLQFSPLHFDAGDKADPKHQPSGGEPQSFNSLLEFPLSTIRLSGKNVGIFNGDCCLLGSHFINKTLIKLVRFKNQPLIFHLHPWKLGYPQQPGAEKTKERLIGLLKNISLSPIRDILDLNFRPTNPVLRGTFPEEWSTRFASEN